MDDTNISSKYFVQNSPCLIMYIAKVSLVLCLCIVHVEYFITMLVFKCFHCIAFTYMINKIYIYMHSTCICLHVFIKLCAKPR